MSINNPHRGHSDHEHGHNQRGSDSENLTVRLRDPYDKIYQWSREQNLAEEFKILYAIFGMDWSYPTFSNWHQEITAPETSALIAGWSEHTLVRQLVQFAERFEADPSVRKDAPLIAHGPSARATKQALKAARQPTALAALIINPLNPHKPNAIERHWPRLLRIWLVFQSALRMVEYSNPCDENIAYLARFLTIDSLNAAKWESITELLNTLRYICPPDPSFSEFTNGLINALNQLRDTDENRFFIPAMKQVAKGNNVPQDQYLRTLLPIRPGLLTPPAPPLIEIETSQDTALSGQIFPSDDPDDTDFVIVAVDPTDTPEQQIITSNSFFIQTNEGSHYLPWVWDKPLPTESGPLRTWIDAQLNSDIPRNRLGAAITWLALEFGRSLFFTLKFQVSDDVNSEWCLNTDFRTIKRRSPERQNSWAPKNQHEIDAVHHSEEVLIADVPLDIAVTLGHFHEASVTNEQPIECLADLWFSQSEESIESWFNRQFKEGILSRISSGPLRSAMGQSVFNNTADSNLARLLEAHPNSALPAACGYSSFSAAEVRDGLASLTNDRDNASRLLGSRLRPLEHTLSSGIKQATDTLRASRKELIRFHNLLAVYTVTALYAATGSRHLKDPFESIRYFNFHHDCVYINDKDSGGARQGRLVPLPKLASKILRHYLEHLTQLASVLRPASENLAQAILEARETGSDYLPLFFGLGEDLQWQSVFDAKRKITDLFDWPLPPNLFRHWYGQSLAKSAISREIIDGFLGHAERGASSYGDFSARTWVADAASTLPIIERMFDKLQFQIIQGECYTDSVEVSEVRPLNMSAKPVFGAQARKALRATRKKRAIADAEQAIDAFLLDQPNANAQNDWNRLINSLTHTETHLAHQYALERLSALERRLDEVNSKCRGEVLQLNVRVRPLKPERSAFRPSTVTALTITDQLMQVTEELTDYARQSPKISKREALALGTVLLCLEKRLSYRQLLFDVAKNVNFRLICDGSDHYIEYSESITDALLNDWSLPVQRHKISHCTAQLLARGSTLTVIPTQVTLRDECHSILCRALEIGPGSTHADILDRLVDVFEAANPAQFPGLVAAALGERQPPTSLPLPHVMRALNRPKAFPSSAPPTQDDDILGRIRSGHLRKDLSKPELQTNAKNFVRGLRVALRDYNRNSVASTVKAIELLCRDHEALVSRSLLTIGGWVCQLILRGPKNRKPSRTNVYARKSLQDYVNALVPLFTTLAYDVDFLSLDGDALTELYDNMLAIKRARNDDVGYFSRRLIDFHRFAQSVGADAPEWEALDIEDAGRHVHPGFISESDYVKCLKQIQSSTTKFSSYEADYVSLVLLCCYRFGLRGSEAVHLMTNDWHQTESMMWLLIRNSSHNQLKSPAGRRPVPLLFPLTDTERDLIERVFQNVRANTTEAASQPVLADLHHTHSHPGAELIAIADSIPQFLIAVLRQVTGLDNVVLHHARHSLVNRIGPLLYGVDTGLTRNLVGNINAKDVAEELLSGTQHIGSRRSAMAMARLVGHAHPRTTQKSYNHFMTEWADSLTPVQAATPAQRAGVVRSAKVFDLDALLDIHTPPDLPGKPVELPAPTFRGIMQSLRLASFGNGYAIAAVSNFLTHETGKVMEKLCTSTTERMRFDMGIKGGHAKWTLGTEDPLAALKMVSTHDWARFLTRAREIDRDATIRLDRIEMPPIHEVAAMVGNSRQLLMSDARQAALVVLTLQLFNITPDQYSVAITSDRVAETDWFKRTNFKLTPTESASTTGRKLKFDPFNIQIGHNEDRRLTYAALVIRKTKGQLVGSSIELMVAFIATATHLYASSQHRT